MGGTLPLFENIRIGNPSHDGTEEQQIMISKGVTERELSIQKGLELFIYIDGASRGNPGRAGAGVYVTDQEGKRVAGIARYLGHKTNNEAEYGALLLGLQEARRLGGKSIHIYTDSELIARQILGIYRVKDIHLRTLHQKAMEMIKGFTSFEIGSIPREENQDADLLANQAIEKKIIREREPRK